MPDITMNDVTMHDRGFIQGARQLNGVAKMVCPCPNPENL